MCARRGFSIFSRNNFHIDQSIYELAHINDLMCTSIMVSLAEVRRSAIRLVSSEDRPDMRATMGSTVLDMWARNQVGM